MRIYELNPILDSDILGSQVLALDDSTQTRKISLDQIRVFLGVGENSTLIPSGTDIHTYFLTAKSGSYYGEGLVNTAQGGAWAAFDWTTHDQGRGTLIETNNVNAVAVHSLAAGAWTNKKVLSVGDFGLGGLLSALPNLDVTSFHSKGVGHADNPEPSQGYAHINLGVSGSYKATLAISYTGTHRVFMRSSLNGVQVAWMELIGSNGGEINGNGSPLTLKAKTLGAALYILAKDFDNSNQWYVGKGTDNNDDVLLNNYKGLNNVILRADGAVNIRGGNGSATLNPDGALSLSDYKYFDTHFDGRYYTKALSDARYLQMPSAGGVGDVALVRSTNGSQYLHGASVPGSALQYAGLYTETDGNDPDIRTETKTLSGTWRITGTMVNPPTTYPMRATTAIRIA